MKMALRVLGFTILSPLFLVTAVVLLVLEVPFIFISVFISVLDFIFDGQWTNPLDRLEHL